jgi:hypothetical protein
MVRLAGFEPATYGLEVRCSIQLSYRRATSKTKEPDITLVVECQNKIVFLSFRFGVDQPMKTTGRCKKQYEKQSEKIG